MTEKLEIAADLDSDELSANAQGDESEVASDAPGRPSSAPRQNREARYRVERNEARAERDALAQRVERLLTREAERLAAKNLANPADLLTLGGVTVQDLLDQDGDVDPDKVDAVVAEILGTRPGLARPKYPSGYDPTHGLSGGDGKPQPSWNALMKSSR